MKNANPFAALSGLVYSTDGGSHCPQCAKPEAECVCAAGVLNSDSDGIARIRRESKGRGGKTVTTIAGLQLTQDELKILTAELKKKCGCGGALKDGVIEIQGDRVELVMGELKQKGFGVKKVGG